MLPLKFCKMCFDGDMVHRFRSSDANAFLTSDRGIPNSRAIRDGVMPALNADRTAFTRPRVNETSAGFNFAVSAGGDCIFVNSERACELVSSPRGVLPRRFNSSSVAACIKSNSSSLKCLTALRRFLGRTYRRGSLSVAAFGAGDAEAVEVVNRSGAVRSAGSRPMSSAWRGQRRTAISIKRKWCCRTGLNCFDLSLHHTDAFASAGRRCAEDDPLLSHPRNRIRANTGYSHIAASAKPRHAHCRLRTRQHKSFCAFAPAKKVFASNHCAVVPAKKVFASNQF